MQPISIPSSFGMQNSSVEVYTNNDGSNGVLLTGDGFGEINKTTHASGSIPDYIEKGGTVPGGLLVVNVQKPNDGSGLFQPERFIDALDWVIKTYPKADLSRISATGLSLGGGPIFQIMANPAWSKRFAALIPVAGTKDATWQDLIAGVKASPTPFRAYGSSKDPNTPTQECFTTYMMVANGFDPAHVLNNTGKFIDLGLQTHTGLWPVVYDFKNSDFWGWLTAQKRTDVAAPVVVAQPPVTPPARKLLYTITTKIFDTGAPDTVVS
jgi:predicted peptidase